MIDNETQAQAQPEMSIENQRHPWKSVTTALIIPINPNQRIFDRGMPPSEAETQASRTEGRDALSPEADEAKGLWVGTQWNLQGLPVRRPGTKGPKPSWFGTGLDEAVKPNNALHIRTVGNGLDTGSIRFRNELQRDGLKHKPTDTKWQTDKCDILAALSDLDVRLLCLELREYSNRLGEEDAQTVFVIVHLELLGNNLLDPGRVARVFRRPSNDDYGKQLFSHIQQLLSIAGIDHGLTNGGFALLEEREKRGGYFPVFQALSTGPVPEHSGLLADHTNWEEDEKWAYLLSTGTTSRLRVPADHVAEASRGTIRSEAVWMSRMDEQGAAYIGWDGDADSPIPDEPEVNSPIPDKPEVNSPIPEQPEHDLFSDKPEVASGVHSRIGSRIHGVYLDLFILALRQRSALDAHLIALDILSRNISSETLDKKLLGIRNQEIALIAFRSQLWFTSVREHEDGTLLLQTFQDRVGTPALLQQLIRRQEDISRVIKLDVQIEEAKSRKLDEKALQIITFLATFAVVPSTVITALTLFGQGSPGMFVLGLVGSVLVTVIVLFLLWLHPSTNRLFGPWAKQSGRLQRGRSKQEPSTQLDR